MEHDLSKTMAELPSAEKKQGGAGRWKPIALALALVAGMVAVLWFVFREQLTPAVTVQAERVLLIEQEGGTGRVPISGNPELLFQASGWIEPDPWQFVMTVKTDGYVQDLFFREGDTVTNGQVLAMLDPADAKLDLALAKARVRKHEAELNSKISIADAEVKQVEAAHYRVAAAVARLTRERDTSERYAKSAPGVISHNDRVAAEQAVVEFEAEEKAARAALTAMEAKAISAKAEIKVAEAALASAIQERAVAQLALDRTVVRSNMDGIIFTREIEPGAKRVFRADDPHSQHIAEVYDPEKLQVRVDVPLAEAGKIEVGQPTKISTAMLPGRVFEGRVTSIVGQADLQRNTLQAKVQIKEPDPRMRPDVLCRVEFLGLPTFGSAADSSSHALWIPVQALEGDSSEQNVWVIDPLTKTVGQRSVKLAGVTKDGYRAVAEGVRANELIVLTAEGALTEGTRVKEAE